MRAASSVLEPSPRPSDGEIEVARRNQAQNIKCCKHPVGVCRLGADPVDHRSNVEHRQHNQRADGEADWVLPRPEVSEEEEEDRYPRQPCGCAEADV